MKDTVTLNNGIEMPRIGYGVYQIPSSATERCVKNALSIGYRSIDTAQCYGNERAVGRAVRESGISRGDIFITTKLWGGRGYKDTVTSIESSLKALDPSDSSKDTTCRKHRIKHVLKYNKRRNDWRNCYEDTGIKRKPASEGKL